MGEAVSGREMQTSVRVAPATKGRIREAAEAAGRSLHAEMAFRLELSVMADEQSPLRHDPLVRMAALVLERVLARNEGHWATDKLVAAECRLALDEMLDHLLGSAEKMRSGLGAVRVPAARKDATAAVIAGSEELAEYLQRYVEVATPPKRGRPPKIVKN